mgnify:FL=1
MNFIKLIYLRWRVGFLAAQWEHAVQLSETYKDEAEAYAKEMKKAQRHLFQLTPPRTITQ